MERNIRILIVAGVVLLASFLVSISFDDGITGFQVGLQDGAGTLIDEEDTEVTINNCADLDEHCRWQPCAFSEEYNDYKELRICSVEGKEFLDNNGCLKARDCEEPSEDINGIVSNENPFGAHDVKRYRELGDDEKKTYICSDGADNDGDDHVDYGDDPEINDPQCENEMGDSELQCLMKGLKCRDINTDGKVIEWCCPNPEEIVDLTCGIIPTTCETRWFSSWDELKEFIGPDNWLEENDILPEECTCENSRLVIYGNLDYIWPSEYMLNYAANLYHLKKSQKEECTFALQVRSLQELSAFATKFLGRFGDLTVLSHGNPFGTEESSGVAYGSFVCGGSFTDFKSCSLGQPPAYQPFPFIAENFCKYDPHEATIKVSETDVGVILSLGEQGISFGEKEGLFCTIGDWVCYKCVTDENNLLNKKVERVECPN